MIKICLYVFALTSGISTTTGSTDYDNEESLGEPTPGLYVAPETATPVTLAHRISVGNDITEAIQNTISEMLKDFSNHLREWNNHKISAQPSDVGKKLPFEQRLNSQKYRVDFSDITWSQNANQQIEDIGIVCEFTKSLKVRVPVQDIELSGHLTIFDIFFAHPSKPVWGIYQYHINLKDIIVEFTAQHDFNIGNGLPNNRSTINVSYGKIKIDYETFDAEGNPMSEEINNILETIKSYVKSIIINENLDTMIREKISYLPIFTHCIHPKNDLLRIYRELESGENLHYYAIKENEHLDVRLHDTIGPVCDGMDLKLDSLMMVGLWNFTSLSVRRYYGMTNFDLSIGNTIGKAIWEFPNSSPFVNTWTHNEVMFNTNTISIHGMLNINNNALDSISVAFKPTFQNEDINSGPWSSFTKTIITNHLNKAIQRSFEKFIQTKYFN